MSLVANANTNLEQWAGERSGAVFEHIYGRKLQLEHLSADDADKPQIKQTQLQSAVICVHRRHLRIAFVRIIAGTAPSQHPSYTGPSLYIKQHYTRPRAADQSYPGFTWGDLHGIYMGTARMFPYMIEIPKDSKHAGCPHIFPPNASMRHNKLHILALCFAYVLGPRQISAQQVTPRKSSLEVMQAFRKMDSEGERLTTSGWYKASKFFSMPARPPKERVIGVIAGFEDIYNNPYYKVTNKEQVEVKCVELGQIDSNGKFTDKVHPRLIGPSVQPEKVLYGPLKSIKIYYLLLTDKQFELDPSSDNIKESRGAFEWKIETFDFEPWVTRVVAIQYLVGLRDRTTSNIIRKNAINSIATLRAVH